jgi:phosphoribosylamine--glycine ligase
MEKVGILVISYGSREAAMVDAFSRSNKYDVELYIADKQKNPFNLEKATAHQVIPDLDVELIAKFASRYEDRIDFGICGPEGPITAGIRDRLEELEIPMVCPKKEYALEVSKVAQRHLLADCCPEANPRFKVFEKKDYKNEDEVKKDVWKWLNELDNAAVVKPDRPGYGKGVGVWGDHFKTRSELLAHFMTIYENDAVIIEEKIDGEESSFQCFCDGKKIVALPETRDYKRAFANDAGPNTGGMGCYKDFGDYLPFMTEADRENEEAMVEGLFARMQKEGAGDGLRGIPFYVAFMHTKEGAKILEINSRGGDPEIATVLPLIEDDFVDVCYSMIEGSLKKIKINPQAAVLTYKVPPTYGGYADKFPDKVDQKEVGTSVDLAAAYRLKKEYGDELRIYPGSMTLRDGQTYSGGSRTVCCVGVADSIDKARLISQEGISAIKGGALWYRSDVGSQTHINKSVTHMKELRA